MFSTLLKTASLAFLALYGASALSINKHHLVHRDTDQAARIPDAVSREAAPLVSLTGDDNLKREVVLNANVKLCVVLFDNLREKLTAVDVSPGFICDFYSQNNCSGHVRWAVQANPTSFFTSLPFLAGWDDRVASMQCYASIWATDFHATIERREIHLEEEEAEIETVSVAQKFDTGISRRAEGNEVNIMATDNLNVFWILPIADGTKNCWNLADNVARKIHQISIPTSYTCDFFSNVDCNWDGDARYGFTSNDNSLLAAPPFIDGWDYKLTSLLCYQSSLQTPSGGPD